MESDMPPKKTTELIPWAEQLAKDALIAQSMEASTATGESFSIQGGVLSFADAPIKDNMMAVVILDAILLNANYPDKFDPKNPSGPNCFAIGHSEADLVPHEVCVTAGTAQAESCESCAHNQWGTSDRGTGKACGNGRRLALIPAGEFGKNGFEMRTDIEYYKTAGIGYLKIPAGSLKGYAGFVKALAAGAKRPPHGIVTQIEVVPGQGDGTKIICTALETLPDELMATIMERRKEALSLIEFPFPAYTAPSKGARTPAPRNTPAKTSFVAKVSKAPVAKAPIAKGAAKAKAPAAKAGFGSSASKKVSKF